MSGKVDTIRDLGAKKNDTERSPSKERTRQIYALNKNKYLLDPEFEKLIYLLKSNMDSDPRNTCLLLLALFTGARATELLSIRKSDLNSYDESIYICGIKGSNDRELPVHSWLFKALEKEASKHNGDRLFPITYNRLRQIWQKYRPVQKKFHSLRHTFAIRLYKKAKDIRLLQVALGHRNITNTMVYADYVYSQQELKKLIL